ncbi:hypothetical protein LEP1GSC060_1259 [Leptospira weilii serovar Ranarum str. ICFT]|uniref:Uncharacterized protein n=1 Tax=Leptospira weilii serovar Ranarum str. ICFT TaxID=1218598 RepID=N1WFD8_9LEPT|nr:hypothetical protein [Leptospira weilii]EMY77690.1 hypothetical protein LEP1GSC060_1259 [Leptospira weilii serovar Ranarum str. ICFT]
MGKLTVRCPRCYESFLFDPETTRQYGDGRFEENSKKENPYRTSSFRTFWENFKQNISNLGSRLQGLQGQTPGKKLARNLLLILLAIGIVRTCFFSPFQDLQNSPGSTSPPEIMPKEPSPPPREQSEPKFEI